MAEIVASDHILHQAYQWLCKARQDYSPNADVWDLRLHWDQQKPIIQQQILAGTYTVSPMIRLEIDGEVKTFWGASDALVLKAIAIVLGNEVAPHLPECWHLKGKGLKAAVSKTQDVISNYKFVFRSDIDSYYATIDHDVLLDLLHEFIADPIILNLICQSMKRTETRGGLFWEYRTTGIPMGSPLSPILAAVALLPLDRALTRAGCFYARFMDDWIVLTKTQSQLRKVVKITNQVLAKLKQAKHPDKTFIGRIQKGFDFLGYHFNGLALKPAKATIDHALAKITQLYEKKASPNLGARLADYARRWRSWVRAGVPLAPGSLNVNSDTWRQPGIIDDLHAAKLILTGMGGST